MKVTKAQRGRGEAWRGSEEALSFEKALVYCCRACIYFMPPQTVAKGRAGSVAVIKEVGRECALRHRELLCSDTHSPREPLEELAMPRFSHAQTGLLTIDTCPVQANFFSDKHLSPQKLNDSRTKVVFLLTLTCTFSIFLFFFFYTSLILSLVGLGDPSDFGPANRGSAFPVSGLPVREGPPSCHPVAHRWRTQTSQLRHQSSHTYARKIHINVRVFLNFFFFFLSPTWSR